MAFASNLTNKDITQGVACVKSFCDVIAIFYHTYDDQFVTMAAPKRGGYGLE